MYGERPTWGDLPARLHTWVAEALGSPVVEARSQPGGFSPGTADRVVTADGRSAFVKAVSTAQNPDTPGLHRREISVLESLRAVTSVPQLLASYDDGEWVGLIIEDVEGEHPLPWTNASLAAALSALAEVAGMTAPGSWPELPVELQAEMGRWAVVADDPPADLDPWLGDRLGELHELAQQTLPRMAGESVAHTDVRADNLLLQPDGRVRLVDWPWASRGAPWTDSVMLLFNVRWAGDLDVRPHLPAIRSLGATDDDVLGLLAGLTGFCTDAARRPPKQGLPTLRDFQRQQAVAGTQLLKELWPEG